MSFLERSFFDPVRALAAALLLIGLAACGDHPTDEGEAWTGAAITGDDSEVPPEPDDAIARVPWQSLGAGVSYKPIDPNLANVLVIYGGYSAEDASVQRWCDEMIRQKNDTLAVGHLYAVKGPDTPGYSNQEIDNGSLAAHLGSDDRVQKAQMIVVIAHSSGTYVADEFFAHVKNADGNVPQDSAAKISYFDLDGGEPADQDFVQQFAAVHFVYAHDATIDRSSHNADGMKSLGDEYASLGGEFEVDADGSGCDESASGGLWCMHDTLINTRPHNPEMYDLVRDYADFTGPHQLVTSYLDSLSEP